MQICFVWWEHVAIVTVIRISWWMCYVGSCIQAPADGFDSVSQEVCVLENERVNERGTAGETERMNECERFFECVLHIHT